MYPLGEKRFLLINKITIISLFVLILAGGVVRSSGSGMGCPDWPKCFGCMIPPTTISQLPAGYQEKYAQKRIVKNEKFAKMLDTFGYSETAAKIRNDESIAQPEEFNVAKTWTEYVNRLIGAITGLLMIGCVIYSIVYLKLRKRIFFLSLVNLILVGFQGWLGSIVVSTNLLAWLVTVHMMIAILILAICIYTYFQAQGLRNDQIIKGETAILVQSIAIFALLVMTVQIALGTEVREQIDGISDVMNNAGRSEWVSKVGFDFNLHRDLAVLVFLMVVFLFFRVNKSFSSYQNTYIRYVFALVLFQIATGISLSYFALPPAAQAIHVFLASLMFGAQFYLVLLMQNDKFTIN